MVYCFPINQVLLYLTNHSEQNKVVVQCSVENANSRGAKFRGFLVSKILIRTEYFRILSTWVYQEMRTLLILVVVCLIVGDALAKKSKSGLIFTKEPTYDYRSNQRMLITSTLSMIQFNGFRIKLKKSE